MKLRKLFTAALLSLTVLCSGVNVYADIIADPYGNRFYETHSRECRLEGNYRRYTVQNDTALCTSPLGKNKTRTVSCGDILETNAYYTDEKGAVWGYAYSHGSGEKEGWFKLSDTELIYDNISFIEEHESELREYSGELDKFAGEYAFKENIYMWEYPNSGKLNCAVTSEELLSEGYSTGQELFEKRNIKYVYTDTAGDEWVYVWIRLWWKPDGWIYVPNPTLDLRTEGIAVSESEEIISENIEAGGDVTDILNVYPTEPYEDTDFILPFVLAACAAALSGGLIAITRKKGR